MLAERREDAAERLNMLRRDMYEEGTHGEMAFKFRDVRQPDFFDVADYFEQLNLPIDLPAREMVERVQALLDHVNEFSSTSSNPEYKYKAGDLIHWIESVVSTTELWAVTQHDEYLNAVIQQFNGFTRTFNEIVSEGNLDVPFFTPLRQRPIPENLDDPQSFLHDLCNVHDKIKQMAVMG